MRVVGVKVDVVSGNSGLILPGDRVDVLVHLLPNHDGGINEPTARTLLQFIKVFAVNDVLNLEGLDRDKSIAAKTISLLVTPEQAQKVTMASEMGQIRLVLRSPEDDNTNTDIPSFSSREMLSGRKDLSTVPNLPAIPAAPRHCWTSYKRAKPRGPPRRRRRTRATKPTNNRRRPFGCDCIGGRRSQDVTLKKYSSSQAAAGDSAGWTSDEPKSSDGGADAQAAKRPAAATAKAAPAQSQSPSGKWTATGSEERGVNQRWCEGLAQRLTQKMFRGGMLSRCTRIA